LSNQHESSIQLKKRFVLLVLTVTFFINFDGAVVIPIIANYAIELGASLFLAGIIVGIYALVHIPSDIILGRVVDKIGRKKLLIIGLFFDGFSMLLYFFANDFVFLLIARIIHGLGGGFGGPSTMSYLGDVTSDERSGRGMALYGIFMGLSNLIGFMVGGMMSAFFGYKTLFLSIAIIMLIFTTLTITLPSIYKPPGIKLIWKEEFQVFKQTIFKKSLIAPYLSILVLYFNMGIITAAYTVILKNSTYDDAQIGMLFAILVIPSMIIHYPAGILSDKIGKTKIIITGLVLISLAFLIFITTEPPFPMLGMLIFGIGHGMIFPTSAGAVKTHTSDDIRGIATGIFYALSVAGVALSSPISGYIFQSFGFLAVLILGIVIPFIAVIAHFILYPKLKG
jgi:MFS family permease